ncbi:Uracil permease [Candida viswanathii]|uniref:Uracil permease n=1 Tax=Candida viswanathii TaxID=5486 RepID=A0A367YIV8_9ASCO|nr:Uracil permease [Candida viswanathii]
MRAPKQVKTKDAVAYEVHTKVYEESANLDYSEEDDGQLDPYKQPESQTPTFWQKLVKTLEVQPSGNMSIAQMFLYNHDLRPVEEARRQWAWYNYVFLWISDSFNINTWQIAATGIQAGGMNWWQTWLSVWLGYALCGIFVSIGARVGTLYHISFPVAARSSFGIYGSLWPVINRVFMSCIWYAVQTAVAGPTFELMLHSIFGKDLPERIHDTIADKDLTTFQFLGIFLFWLFQLPFLWFPPHKIRHLFTVKAYVVPPAGIAFLIWTIIKAGGAGPVFHQKSQVHGSALAWAFVESTFTSLANFCTLIINAPDFSRFAKEPSFAMKYLVYTLSIPICFSLTSLIGILVTSASESMYGVAFWSPLDVLKMFLNDYTPGNRAGVFFLSAAFALAQLGTKISANSLSFGTDCTALLPRFINIRRGSYICAFLALAVCPWKLISSSSRFTTYLSAYAVFLSSVAGVAACDYFYLRRGYIDVINLYSLQDKEDPTKKSIYRYNKIGVNWRAYAAYICGILPNIVGFVGATGAASVPIGATKVYRLNFFMGFFSAFIVYAVLCFYFPVPTGTKKVGPFEKGWFEEWPDVESFDEELLGPQKKVQ